MNVPQEKNESLGGIRKIMYAKDNTGHFNTFKYGSKIEEFATKIAVHEYELLEKECLESIKSKKSSPIKYYMYKNRMDLITLSSNVDMISFRVKRHLNYKHFIKLDDEILRRYANAFDINIKQLKDFKYE